MVTLVGCSLLVEEADDGSSGELEVGAPVSSEVNWVEELVAVSIEDCVSAVDGVGLTSVVESVLDVKTSGPLEVEMSK